MKEENHGAHKVITIWSHRPKRDNPIGREDIVDLRISLYMAKTVDDFLKEIK